MHTPVPAAALASPAAALIAAADAGRHEDICSILQNKPCHCGNAVRDTALHHAVRHSRPRAAGVLVSMGANPQAVIAAGTGEGGNAFTLARNVCPEPLQKAVLAQLTPFLGKKVVLRGLQQRTDINGLAGLAQAYDEASDRYMVTLDTGEAVNCKLGNMRLEF